MKKLLFLVLVLLSSIIYAQETTIKYNQATYRTETQTINFDTESTVVFNYNNDALIKITLHDATKLYSILDDGEIITVENIKFIKYLIEDEDNDKYHFYIAMNTIDGCSLVSQTELLILY